MPSMLDVPTRRCADRKVPTSGAFLLRPRATARTVATRCGRTGAGIEEWSGPDPLSAADTEVVTEVAWDTPFEGTSVAFVGTAEEVPFRVYLLEEPARVVLEVADPT